MAAPVVSGAMFVLRWRTVWKLVAAGVSVVILGSVALVAGLVVLMSGVTASAYEDEAANTADAWRIHPNGELPAEALCEISWNRAHALECNAATALEELGAAYRVRFGADLPVTGGYVDLGAQVDAFNAAYDPWPDESYRGVFDDVVTWRDTRYVRMAGIPAPVPGTSSHGWGSAVDLGGKAGLAGSAENEWLMTHGARFEWVSPEVAADDGVSLERWHFDSPGHVVFVGEAAFNPVGGSEMGAAAATAAYAQLGLPYVWGGGSLIGPTGGGFDCSGLVRFAIFQGSGGAVELPRTAKAQGNAGRVVVEDLGSRVDLARLEPGDAIAFNLTGRVGSGLKDFDHIGLYIGGGKMVHAPVAGTPVSVVDLKVGYYATKSWSVRRYW